MSTNKCLLAVLVSAASLLAADAAIGTWKLNPAKSKFSPGPPPQSATVTYEASGSGIRRTGETVKVAISSAIRRVGEELSVVR